MRVEITMSARLYSEFRRKLVNRQNPDVMRVIEDSDNSGNHSGPGPARLSWPKAAGWDPRSNSGVAKIVNFLKEADDNERRLMIDGQIASAWLSPKKKRPSPKDMVKLMMRGKM